jgi:transglutaminase-like putative cysteine protease
MKIFTLIICLFAGSIFASEQAEFSAEPEWITQASIPDSSEVPYAKIKYGAHYLLFDRQVKVPATGDPAFYFRFVTKIINQTGLDDQSQINVSFDPIYERVRFHKLNVLRDGKIIQKLPSARISYLDQEEDLDRQLYNGLKTMNLLLDDLRVDDILDYSYTIEGYNPVLEGKFNADFEMQWSVPVASMNLRLLWQKNTRLNSKILNSDWKLSKRETGNGSEYIVRASDIEPAEVEDDAPSWVDPYAAVYFSEQAGWGEVVDWGRGLFSKVVSGGESIESIARDIEQGSPDRATKIARTLQFVQNEIRYVGIELGRNSHQAVAAEITLKRRYGDCKDKATLMISILQAMGIEAWPALVNTYAMDRLAQRLPSMQAFNHVIVAVADKDDIYWLDPTRQFQVGRLDHIYQPDYGLALVLKAGSSTLTPMNSVQVSSGYDVSEHYDLTDDSIDGAKLSVITEYYGRSAESKIARLERNGLDKIKADYLEFYRGFYPSIEQIEVSVIGVDQDNFRFKVREEYLIANFWETEEESQREVGWVYSNVVSSILDEPGRTKRAQDYELSFPWSLNQTVKISLPDKNRDFDDSEFSEVNRFFEFHRNKKYDADSKTVYLKYSYNSKSDHVPAAEFTDYLEALGRARDELDFGFYRVSENSANTAATSEFNMLMAAICLYGAIIVLTLFLWFRHGKHNPFAGNMRYYPMDSVKFIFLWVVTWGIFPIYWFYRNWKYAQSEPSPSKMMPSMRGLFYQFWYYPMYRRLSASAQLTKAGAAAPGKFQATALSVAFFTVITLSAIVDTLALPLLLLSAILALPLLNMVNRINHETPAAIAYNSSWSFRHFLIAIIFLPLFVFTLGPEFGLLPSASVVRGEKLLAHDIKFMQRAGIIHPGEKVEYFYSDALLMIRNDGNGFTARQVFSYWVDNNDYFNVDTVEFDDIGDIKVTWASGFGDNTVVEVFRNDQSRVILYVSSIDSKDKLFVQHLMARWKQSDQAKNQT